MDTDTQDLQRQLDKLKRRQKRNARTAWAEGFLTGVCGVLRPGDVAIDCGANVGDVSARLLASGAKVIAFDPEPWAVDRLNDRFADNANFELHNAACGTSDGSIRLYRATDFGGNEANASVKSSVVSGGRSMDDTEGSWVDVPQVDFVRFTREAIARYGTIAFLKMDIEGAELDLLDEMDKADLFTSIRCTVVETHEKKFRDLRPRYRKLRERFAARYRPEHVNLDWI